MYDVIVVGAGLNWQDALNVWCGHFNRWLGKKAKEKDAEVRNGVTVLSCIKRDGFVEVNLRGEENYMENAMYVLDCEGIIGVLKRKLTEDIPKYITTFQTINEGSIDIDPHYFYAYLQPELSEYDAWFNVKEDLLVLGVSV